MSIPDLSVIIPVYNRGDLIRHTLQSVQRATGELTVQTIIVDDGSAIPVEADLPRLGFSGAEIHRQENRGLLFARLAGLSYVRGRYTLFLDSDDLVGPEKFCAQLSAMDATQSDVSYTDTAHAAISHETGIATPVPDSPALITTEPAKFFLNVQPPPHSPIFRTTWLRDLVARAFFPPSPLYNSVAEIWLYHNAAPFAARVVKVPGIHTIVGTHTGPRLTNHWEKLAVASLAVMEAFVRHCPATPTSAHCRQLLGEAAFRAWRALPRGMERSFSQRLLALWQQQPGRSSARLGGGGFRTISALLGPETAARALRLVRGADYASCRTLEDAEFARLLGALPPP